MSLENLMPAIIAIVSMVIGFLLNIWVGKIQRNDDFRDKHLYDTYQKRISIYGEILGALTSMTSIERLPMDIAEQEIGRKIRDYVHELQSFVFRLSVLGSNAAIKCLHSVITEIQREPEECSNMTVAAYNASLRAVLCNAVQNGLASFTQTVREESGAVRLDDRLVKLAETKSDSTPKKGKDKSSKRK